MNTTVYSVPSISCGHCKMAIEGEVAKLTDVDTVVVDVATKLVNVTGSASEADVRAAIDEAGYQVEAVEFNP